MIVRAKGNLCNGIQRERKGLYVEGACEREKRKVRRRVKLRRGEVVIGEGEVVGQVVVVDVVSEAK